MDYNFEQFELTEQSEIQIDEGTITTEESHWLKQNGVLNITGFKNNTGEVNTATLDVERLSQIAFEFDLLKEVASSVEIDILETFRYSSNPTLTTAQIANSTGRPKSSVSRALTRLTEKGKITKVQAGVYLYE